MNWLLRNLFLQWGCVQGRFKDSQFIQLTKECQVLGHNCQTMNCGITFSFCSVSRMYFWWGLCPLYLHTCQVRVTIGNSGLCCPCIFRVLINPFTAKFPGSKMHAHTCKLYIFQSGHPFSVLCILMKIFSHASAAKKAEGFLICTFIGLFQLTSLQWKG